MNLRPLWSYYGGKHRISVFYPKPRYRKIREVFAGSAGYACRYSDHEVELYDLNPIVAGLWQYLITVKESEIRSLPAKVEDLDALSIPQEAKWLIGFWLSKGSSRPVKKPSKWMEKEKRMSRGYWGGQVRERIASQLQYIRHWKVYNQSYETAPDDEATWYVDPPYMGDRGKGYKFHKLDYAALGKWCESRKGQVIACEGPDGNWLPFVPLLEHKSTVPVHGKAVFGKEVIWHRSEKKVGFGLL